MTKVDWHYPRRDFAQRTFTALTEGPTPAMTLFGPRRIGKTQFLQRDLGPIAARRGHRVLYVSFWQSGAALLDVLLYEADRALAPQGYPDRLRAWAGSLPLKARLKVPGGHEVSLDLGSPGAGVPAERLLLLDMLLGRLADPAKPALLMLDEVQELATAPQGPAIMAALRTTLDRQKDGLRSLFTGSSQVGLDKVFSARAAPFYRFASPLTLPPLSDDFVDHQLANFAATHRRPLDRTAALAFFDRFHRNPEVFNRWLTTLGQNPAMPPDTASEQTAQEIARQFDHDGTWRRLSPIQRAMARTVAERSDGLFGEAAAPRLADLLQAPAPPASARQSAMRTLISRGIVDKIGRDYRIADPLFEAWVLDRDAADF